jgi:hypothetical protein
MIGMYRMYCKSQQKQLRRNRVSYTIMSSRVCFCSNCQGKLLQLPARIKAHKQADRSLAVAKAQELAGITNRIETLPESTPGELNSKCVVAPLPPPLTGKQPPSTSSAHRSVVPVLTNQTAGDDLWTMDFELHKRLADIREKQEKQTLATSEWIDEQEKWIGDLIAKLKTKGTRGKVAEKELTIAMVDQASWARNYLQKLREEIEGTKAVEQTLPSTYVFDSSTPLIPAVY